MILLFCFKKQAYAQLAYNIAFSLKHFNPEIPITIYHDGILNALEPDYLSYFDNIIQDETLNVETFKTKLYDLSPYDETLYLDVDGVTQKDINPLIAELRKKDFYVRNWANHKLEQGNVMPHMRWAYANDLWEHFKLPQDAQVPATQTSLIWFIKNNGTKNIFEAWKKALATPLPVDKLREQWGGAQPDELYLNIALAQTNILPDTQEEYMFFGNKFDNRTFEQLTRDFYFLSVYGGRHTISRYRKLYDQRLREFHRAHHLISPFQYDRIMRDKHVNNIQPKPIIRRNKAARHNNAASINIRTGQPGAKSINIICPDNGVGLSIDRKIISSLLPDKYSVKINGGKQIYKYDLNIWCERMNPHMINYAEKNIIIPNPEWFHKEWIPLLEKIDLVLCKTKDCEKIFSKLTSKIIYTGFTSQDRYIEKVQREKKFVHFAGLSSHKGTQQIIEAAHSFDLPHITIFMNPFLFKHNFANTKINPEKITIINRRLTDEEFWHEQNKFQFHLCTSQYEGFGHYLNEARSIGAVIITTDFPPMNELVNGYGFKCNVKEYGHHMLAQIAIPDADSIADCILRANALDDPEIKNISQNIRNQYLEEKQLFTSRFSEIIENILN